MSQRYQGGVITKTPITPSGPYQTSTAPGIWTLNQALQYIKQGIWPTAGNFLYYAAYSDTGFGTYGFRIYANTTQGIYYSGNGATACIGSAEGRFGLLNSSGVKQYATLLAGNFSCIPTGSTDNVAGDSSGNVFSNSYTANSGNFATKFNSSNTKVYSKIASSSAFGYAGFDIAIDSAGLALHGGYQTGNLRFLKLASDGASFSFQKQVYLTSAPSTTRQFWGMALDSSDNVHAVCIATSAYVLKFDSTVSSLTWGRVITAVGGSTFIVASMTVDSSGNVYIVGYKNGSPKTQVIVKYNSSGTVQWGQELDINSSTITSYSNRNNRFITTDSSGNVYALLPSTASSTSSCLVKYNSSGVIQWQRQFYTNSGGDLIPNGVRIIGSEMYVAFWKSSGYNGVLWKLPIDGSLTGSTVSIAGGSYTYQASSFTDTTVGVTETASGGWTFSSSSYTLSDTTSPTTFSNDSANFTKVAV